MKYNKYNLAVTKFASKSDMKPELASVYFSKHKTVATDSFRLLEVTTPESKEVIEREGFTTVTEFDPSEPFILAKAKDVAKLKLKKGEEIVIVKTQGTGKVGLATTGPSMQHVTPELIEKPFYPDYEQVFSALPPALAAVTLNATYLSELAAALKDFGKFGSVTLSLHGENRAIKITASNEETGQVARALLMPLNK